MGSLFKMCFSSVQIKIYILRRWVGFEVETRVDTSMFPGRVGVAPNCSVGLGGRAKSGKRDNCLFCRADSFARAISRPAKAALSFYQCKIHSFFATHHSTSIHIWSSSFDTNFTLVTKIKVKLFSFTCFSILFLAKTGLKLIKDIGTSHITKALGLEVRMSELGPEVAQTK